MPTWTSLSSVDHQEGRAEPRPGLLEMPGEPGQPMQDLCMVQLPAGMEGRISSEVPQSGIGHHLQQPDQQGEIFRDHVIQSTTTPERSEDMSSHRHGQDRDQCLCDQGALPPVQHHGGRPQEDQGGDRRDAPEEDSRFIGLDDTGNHRCGDRGGAEGLLPVATRPRTELGIEEPTELEAELMQLAESSHSKQIARLERQMEASLDRAHGIWSEVMSSLAQSSEKAENKSA